MTKIPSKELILVAGLNPATLLKNGLLHRYFSRILTTDNTFFPEQLPVAAFGFIITYNLYV